MVGYGPLESYCDRYSPLLDGRFGRLRTDARTPFLLRVIRQSLNLRRVHRADQKSAPFIIQPPFKMQWQPFGCVTLDIFHDGGRSGEEEKASKMAEHTRRRIACHQHLNIPDTHFPYFAVQTDFKYGYRSSISSSGRSNTPVNRIGTLCAATLSASDNRSSAMKSTQAVGRIHPLCLGPPGKACWRTARNREILWSHIWILLQGRGMLPARSSNIHEY